MNTCSVKRPTAGGGKYAQAFYTDDHEWNVLDFNAMEITFYCIWCRKIQKDKR